MIKNTTIFSLVIAFMFLGFFTAVHADTACGDPALNNASSTTIYTICGNGSPENVVGPWGFTNSQLPHVLQGQSVIMSNGLIGLCPFWFPMYCVDISHTAYFLARWSK